MRLITQQQAATMLGVSDRSIRNLISRGNLTGYRVPGLRAVRVDQDEIRSKLQAIPSAVARREWVTGPEKFKGHVRTAPAGATVVPEVVE
jgi:excisionase family DNA binding protein